MNSYDSELRKKSLECVKQLRLIDNELMKVVFEDKASTEQLLCAVLGKQLTVQQAKTEYVISNLYGRSIRIDIFAVDENGLLYSIEIQRDDSGAHPKRARYIGSILDSNITEPGEKLENLHETYVIFITENDVLGGNRLIYHINKYIEELNKPFGDGAHIIYVNGAKTDDSQLGKLMHDFKSTDSKDMHNSVLAERVRYFKETEEGEVYMCDAVEKLIREESEQALVRGILKGKAEGKAEGKEDMIRRMRLFGISEEQINAMLSVDLEKEAA